ncbi:SDR family NAD(P)-dependent oxidoreductase [Conexibacter sp. S30A1]|uniref:SDR family NAD(P)-dependent oxidoreductase n=1 Tax=Conexibacter sp. S30A1 TaxID=2937800 RepID=UPI00200D21D4|nr:SDR family oxidoreductase [Conexibacter sp. S30A1]
MGRLDNKVAIITGTAGGQGRAAALLFAREGAKIVGCDVGSDYYSDTEVTGTAAEYSKWTAKGLDETVALVRAAGGEMVALQPCDLTKQEDADALIQFALETYEKIDILYNNAAKGEFAWFDEMSHEQFWKGMTQELDTVFLPTKAVWPHMVAQKGGAIVNTASMSATKVYAALPCISHMTVKAAVQGFSRHLAFEGAPHGIRVNSVAPGLIASPSTGPFLDDPEFRDAFLRESMIQRVGTPEDVARVALFLASDDASFVTGANYAVDGGATGM